MRKAKRLLILPLLLVVAIFVAGCSEGTHNALYEAETICHGPWVKSVEAIPVQTDRFKVTCENGYTKIVYAKEEGF